MSINGGSDRIIFYFRRWLSVQHWVSLAIRRISTSAGPSTGVWAMSCPTRHGFWPKRVGERGHFRSRSSSGGSDANYTVVSKRPSKGTHRYLCVCGFRMNELIQIDRFVYYTYIHQQMGTHRIYLFSLTGRNGFLFVGCLIVIVFTFRHRIPNVHEIMNANNQFPI